MRWKSEILNFFAQSISFWDYPLGSFWHGRLKLSLSHSGSEQFGNVGNVKTQAKHHLISDRERRRRQRSWREKLACRCTPELGRLTPPITGAPPGPGSPWKEEEQSNVGALEEALFPGGIAERSWACADVLPALTEAIILHRQGLSRQTIVTVQRQKFALPWTTLPRATPHTCVNQPTSWILAFQLSFVFLSDLDFLIP